MAEGFHTVEDEQTLKAVVALARDHADAPKTESGELEPAFEHLASQIVRFATGEDRNWDEPTLLLSRALDCWTSSVKRAPREALISLKLDKHADWRESRLVLDVVTDDRPFIVDSISGALAEAGKPVSFFVNAVVDVVRDSKGARVSANNGASSGETVRESMIHAEMDPPVDDAELDALRTALDQVLNDVSMAVDDWEPMRARLGACIAQLERAQPAGADREDLRESIEFLKWLWDNRFAFLGARRYDYRLVDGVGRFEHDPTNDLGIARDPEKRILKSTYTEDGALSPAVQDFINSGESVLIAKANAKSLVHRRVHMDYVGVKSYAVDGRVTGEDRFIGLFTADAYNRPASDIPVLRAKVRKVAEGAAFMPGGHNEKALINILDTFPRDEIFQSDIPSLRETALGVLRLYKRPRTKLFLRRDRFDRFVSALVFVPRDQFSSSVREEIGAVLAEVYDGYVAAFTPTFGDASLVRVHFIIGINPGAPEGPGVVELTRRLRAITRSWPDALLDEMRETHNGAAPKGLFSKYDHAFDAGYRDRQSPAEGLADITELERMGTDRLSQRVFRNPGDPAYSLNLKLYRRGAPLRLSDLIPRLENLGLNVVQEDGYLVRPRGGDNGEGRSGDTYWIHDFHTEQEQRRDIVIDDVKRNLETAFAEIVAERAEDDGFNALIVLAGLNWREAWILRAAAKYALQAGFTVSQSYIEDTLARHPDIARALIGVFHARFNPAGPSDMAARAHEAAEGEEKVRTLLDQVESLDEDRIIRRILNFFGAVTRTNFFQRDENGEPRPCIAFKIDSRALDEIPDPKPFREIFVSGPRVDGVHLRFGPVARGGLRWSDRREDFRTEVLGLVKAQRVKNAVIVPAGAKGCFFPKRLPQTGDRSAVFEEGREAYKCFVRSLLDVTDNIAGGATTPPTDTVVWDEPDPYLVVAADKGTATFSDTANALATERGFWLGDAFASGGSVGYDHKAMGITARGAWEAVKRHFREIGKDIQEEPFTVAGVGDMSGDVFGNGMLLSKQIKLVAAFDHRDIFLDPDPDPAVAWDERARLFELQRSSWADYDTSLISKGGGVFSRRAKSIPLSSEIKALLDLDADKITPNDLIKAILKARVELFWLGGIGTYFKARAEENWRVGDRANDPVRIDAEDMRMAVVGEGANLGLTQDARIAFARAGGRVNTDAVDNAAGVDCSDHEVNIKILLAAAIEKGDIKTEDREALLKKMTDDVADHVLQHNYDQTRAISLMSARGLADVDAAGRYMNALEAAGRLDRALERLPDDKALAARRQRGETLTRPELAVLAAYAKMHLFDALVASNAPDDPTFESDLFAYFPKPLRGFNHATVQHRLRREIIATRLANEIVDTCGAVFPNRMAEATGASYADIALVYEAAREILGLAAFAAAIDDLDNKAPASLQNDLYNAASELLRQEVYRLLNDAAAMDALDKRGVKGLVTRFKKPYDALKASIADALSPLATAALRERREAWIAAGAPEDTADAAALMPTLGYALDIVNLARKTKWSETAIGALFFAIGDKFGVNAVRASANEVKFSEHFERLAVKRIVEELTESQAALTRNAAAFAGAPPAGAPAAWIAQLLESWSIEHEAAIERMERYLGDLDLSNDVGVGKLTLCSRKLAELVDRTGKR